MLDQYKKFVIACENNDVNEAERILQELNVTKKSLGTRSYKS